MHGTFGLGHYTLCMSIRNLKRPGWSRAGLAAAAALALLMAGCGRDDPDPATQDADGAPIVEAWTGDLDGMVERRQVRALVPYGPEFYFMDERGTQRGLSHAFMQAFEGHLNEHLDRGLLRVPVVMVPVTRDRLIPWLLEGRGDIIAADLTITESRIQDLLFTEPLIRGAREQLISGPSAEPLDSLDDLSGRRVFARPGSSYFESLEELNEEFSERGMEPVRIDRAPEHFEVGDVLEMVNAGIVDHAVSDDYLAGFWEQVLPDIQVHEDLVLREGADIAFAVRPENTELKELLDDFLQTHRAGTLFGNVTLERFLRDTRWVDNPAQREQRDRFQRYAGLFRDYADSYDLDWLMLAALAYQESRLDHSARSPAGAVGIMQLLPTTGAEMGVGDILELENNIHAAARYVRWMIDRYYSGGDIDEDNRTLFALASYNAGPRRVREMRAEARELDLDPDVWFDNVELVAARRIGRETVQYVSNIYKYYIAYRLIIQRRQFLEDNEVPVPEPA